MLRECQLQHTWRDRKYASLAVARRTLLHRSCTMLHCTSHKMLGFMGCRDPHCEFWDQPSTEKAVNGVKVGHSVRPSFKDQTTGTVTGACGVLAAVPAMTGSSVVLLVPQLCSPTHIRRLVSGRRKIQPAATSAQGARRSLWWWLSSIQQHGQQERDTAAWKRLFIAGEISAKENFTVSTQISWDI